MPSEKKKKLDDASEPALKKRKIEKKSNENKINSNKINNNGSEITLDSIKNLLNIDTRKLTKEEIFNHLNNISLHFIRDIVLIIGNIENSTKKLFRLSEFEFYLLDGNNHSDVFTHCDNLQYKTCGNWYFHHSGNNSVEGFLHMCKNTENKKWNDPRPNSKFRGGTFKGMDITFGVEGEVFGGILIRSIELLEENKIVKNTGYTPKLLVQGPCKCVEKVLEITKTKDISSLVKNKQFSKNVFDNNGLIHLDLSKNYTIKKLSPIKNIKNIDNILKTNPHYKWYSLSPRVGLTLKKTKLSTDELTKEFENIKKYYILAPYRCIRMTNAHEIKKYNILIGLCLMYTNNYYKYKLKDNLSKLSKPSPEIIEYTNSITKQSTNKLNKSLNDCEQGRENADNVIKQYFNKMKSDNTTLCKLFGWYIS